MDWMRYRKIYFLISFLIIAVGVFSLSKWGLKFGVDFKGGSIAEYKFKESISSEELTKKISEKGINVFSIQTIEENRYLFRTTALSQEDEEKLRETLFALIGGSNVEELRLETVGPTIGPELVRKTILAMVIASAAILFWVAYQFKSLKFGSAAILAMFHDTLVVIGVYSLLGHFFGADVDFLFVTALLTILSFSVHDTIVVYDRIRESQKNFGGSLYDLANKATTETMVRSLNNSLTIIFMLFALTLLGGSTLRWFSATLLIGTISGTYSSPFVAVPLLITLDELRNKIFLRKKS